MRHLGMERSLAWTHYAMVLFNLLVLTLNLVDSFVWYDNQPPPLLPSSEANGLVNYQKVTGMRPPKYPLFTFWRRRRLTPYAYQKPKPKLPMYLVKNRRSLQTRKIEKILEKLQFRSKKELLSKKSVPYYKKYNKFINIRSKQLRERHPMSVVQYYSPTLDKITLVHGRSVDPSVYDSFMSAVHPYNTKPYLDESVFGKQRFYSDIDSPTLSNTDIVGKFSHMPQFDADASLGVSAIDQQDVQSNGEHFPIESSSEPLSTPNEHFEDAFGGFVQDSDSSVRGGFGGDGQFYMDDRSFGGFQDSADAGFTGTGFADIGESGFSGTPGRSSRDGSSAHATYESSLGFDQSSAGGFGSFAPVSDFSTGGQVGFSDDGSQCEGIDTRRCTSDNQCLCYGFYHCSNNLCSVIGYDTSDSGVSSIGGTWQDVPVESLNSQDSS